MGPVSNHEPRMPPAQMVGMAASVVVTLGIMSHGEDEMEPTFGHSLFSSIVGSLIGYVGTQKVMQGSRYGIDDAGPDSVFAAIMGVAMAVGGWVGHKIGCGGGSALSFGCKFLEFAGMIGGMWGMLKLLENQK